MAESTARGRPFHNREGPGWEEVRARETVPATGSGETVDDGGTLARGHSTSVHLVMAVHLLTAPGQLMH